MPKRRKNLLTMTSSAQKRRHQQDKYEESPDLFEDMSTARDRLQGALMDMMDQGENSNVSSDVVVKRKSKQVLKSNEEDTHESDYDSDTSDKSKSSHQPYIIKLFDRSVDFMQFSENTPLYPICRAWILNKPRTLYGSDKNEPNTVIDGITLAGPEGEVISSIPPLLPVQEARNKDNINLNYDENIPSRDQLLQSHLLRWNAIRQAWQEQNHLCEKRYEAAQRQLEKINAGALV